MTAPSSRRPSTGSGTPSGLVDGDPVIVTDPKLPPVALTDEHHEKANSWTWPKILIWSAIALLGAVAWTMLAIVRGETVNAI